MAFPKQVKPYTVSWLNVGQSSETMRVSWNYLGNTGNEDFIVGTECFLEDPADSASMALVPDEHLIASASMMSILSGGLLIGTKEWKDAFSAQDTMNLQTIVGLVKLKDDPVWKGTTVIPGGVANVYDVTFYRSGQTGNTKVVEIDTFSGSQYSNRVDSCAHSVYCVPGAIFKQFPTYKKSNLGAVDSANRHAVEAFVAGQLFWV